jgi:uncharacterized protein (DUF849 family)
MSEYLPITPEQIAEQAVDASRAGAAILHLHACNPADGSPTPNPAVFEQFVPATAARTDAIINITTGGSARATLEDRLAYALKARPELCSLNMRSMNFASHRAARGVANWKYPWERAYVEESEGLISRNTFRDIRDILTQLGEAHDTRFEFECYDVGHLYNLAYFVEEGLVKGRIFLQCVLGVTGGLSRDPENLFLVRSTADRLFGRAIDVRFRKNRHRLLASTYFDPIKFKIDRVAGADGFMPHEIAPKLSAASIIVSGQIDGPEDVLLDEESNLYCAARDGRLLRLAAPDYSEVKTLAKIGGRPLGLTLDQEGRIVCCVAGMGLVRVTTHGDVELLTDQTERSLLSIQDDTVIRMADDLDIAPDGVIYFTDATKRYDIENWGLDLLEGRPNGRLLSYDPRSKKTRTVCDNLVFPNGVCFGSRTSEWARWSTICRSRFFPAK